jgi:hypothetical protein
MTPCLLLGTLLTAAPAAQEKEAAAEAEVRELLARGTALLRMGKAKEALAVYREARERAEKGLGGIHLRRSGFLRAKG